MADTLRCTLLLVNAFAIVCQLSTWSMNYGFAFGVPLDACVSLVLVLLVVLRGLWGPIDLPLLRTAIAFPFHWVAIAPIVYVTSSGIVTAVATVRVFYSLYMCEVLLNDWPRDDGLRSVRSDYYFMESIVWTLQAAVHGSIVYDLMHVRTRRNVD